MDFRFTPEQDEWRREVRSTIDSLITSDIREEMESDDDVGPGPAGKRFMRELGSRGLLGISWPEEYGGLGRSLMDQYIFSEEIGSYGGLYTNGTAVNMVGPTIMNVGTDEQRAEWLPKMLSGEVECALGYTEPGAGTDLAGLQTRAVVDGDDYVINGQKLFTSAGHFSSHVWLLARTDTEVRKHRGLSVFLVPMDSDGISVRPLWRMDSGRTNEVFFDNVRIPRQNLIGEPNRGWYHVAMALDFERISIGSRYTGLLRRLNRLVEYANKTEDRWPATVPRSTLQNSLRRDRHEAGDGQTAVVPDGVDDRPGHRPQLREFGAEDCRYRPDPGGRRLRIRAAGSVRPTHEELAIHVAGRRDGAGVQEWDLPEIRRRRQRGPAQHHRAARPRDAEGRLAGAAGPPVAAGRRWQNIDRGPVDGPVAYGLAAEAERCRQGTVRGRVPDELGPGNGAGRTEAIPPTCGSAYRVSDGPGCRSLKNLGGSGGTLTDLAVLLEEFGRALVPGPFFNSVAVVGLTLLDAGSDEQRSEILPRIADGSLIATAALLDESARYGPDSVSMQATRRDGGYVLNGTKMFVEYANSADLMLVPARSENGVVLLLVPTSGEGISLTRLDSIARDPQFAVEFKDVFVADGVVGDPQQGGAALKRALDRAALLHCTHSVGGAQHVVDMTVAYTKQRVQFDRAIATFQSVQHDCADMVIAIDSARSGNLRGDHQDRGRPAGGQGDRAGQVADEPRLQVDDADGAADTRRHRVHGGVRPPTVDAQGQGSRVEVRRVVRVCGGVCPADGARLSPLVKAAHRRVYAFLH